MVGGTHVTAWVSEDTKRRFVAVAEREGLSESALLKRMVVLMLQSTSVSQAPAGVTVGRSARGSRLTVRLSPEDRLLLRHRAAARGMAGATYVSVVVRSHLRRLAPLPKDELLALKRVVAELGAVGRNLNQIARASNATNRVAGPQPQDLRAILRVCEALRDHVKGLLKANLASWEAGHAEEGR